MLPPHFTNGDPRTTAHRPLANPYDAPRGALVYDVLTSRLGTVMERVGSTVHLRPISGGCEWETDKRFVDRPPATERPEQPPSLVGGDRLLGGRTFNGARRNLPPPAA